MFKFIVLVAFVGLAAAGSLDSDVHAEVKALDNDISPEGAFHYGFQTSNGISIASAGDEKGAQGSFEYISPEGEAIKETYIAGVEGFLPSGSHLPTPPPIPEAIARAVEWILAHPQAQEQLVSRKL